MTGSPTPEEREKADAELRAKEAAEQATLPYKWTQTIKDVDVTIPIDGKYKGRDLDVKLSKNALKVAIKGQDPIIDVR
jgi:HSP20 family molecular chaperone IbpA